VRLSVAKLSFFLVRIQSAALNMTPMPTKKNTNARVAKLSEAAVPPARTANDIPHAE
jgi:hypothetical protein